MRKIIRLTESDLARIVKRVINKERLIKESLTISDIELDVSYGNLMTKVDGEEIKYKIKVDCGKIVLGQFITAYEGPISLSNIWKSEDGGISGKDNTGKVFKIPYSKSKSIVNKMKNADSKIETEGEGTILKIKGKCFVTLTKK